MFYDAKITVWEFCEQKSEEKHLKNSLSSLASSDVMMEFISSRDFLTEIIPPQR